MRVTLSDEAKRYIGLFADRTGVTPTDCLVESDRLVFLIPIGRLGEAIGPGGSRVNRVEEAVGRRVELVEDADTPAAFVESVLAPAAIESVTISEQDGTIAFVEVREGDRGLAIGRDGRTIEAARELAERHHDIADVQLV